MNEDPYCHLSCPHCGGGVDVLWEQLGEKTVCGRCGEPFLAEVPQGDPHLWRDEPRKSWPRGVVLCVGGVLLLLVAAALWYVSIHQPLEEMRRKVPQVSYSMKRIAFIPLFAAAGAGMTLMGLLSPFFGNREPRNPGGRRAIGVVIFVLLMVPGFFLYTWFEGEMKKEGYERGMLGAQPRPIPVPKMDIPRPPARPDMDQFNKQLKEVKDKARKIQEEAQKGNR